jgi:hypothetical protein
LVSETLVIPEPLVVEEKPVRQSSRPDVADGECLRKAALVGFERLIELLGSPLTGDGEDRTTKEMNGILPVKENPRGVNVGIQPADLDFQGILESRITALVEVEAWRSRRARSARPCSDSSQIGQDQPRLPLRFRMFEPSLTPILRI